MTASISAGMWNPTRKLASAETKSPNMMNFFTFTRSAIKPLMILPIAYANSIAEPTYPISAGVYAPCSIIPFFDAENARRQT